MRRLTSENKERKYKMAKILISPSKYLQGAGEMKNLGTYAAKSGKKALVLISKGGYKRNPILLSPSLKIPLKASK